MVDQVRCGVGGAASVESEERDCRMTRPRPAFPPTWDVASLPSEECLASWRLTKATSLQAAEAGEVLLSVCQPRSSGYDEIRASADATEHVMHVLQPTLHVASKLRVVDNIYSGEIQVIRIVESGISFALVAKAKKLSYSELGDVLKMMTDAPLEETKAMATGSAISVCGELRSALRGTNNLLPTVAGWRR